MPEAIFNLIFMLFTVFLNAFIIGTLTLVRALRQSSRAAWERRALRCRIFHFIRTDVAPCGAAGGHEK